MATLPEFEDGVDQRGAVLCSPSSSPDFVSETLGRLKDCVEVVLVVDLVDAVTQEPRMCAAIHELAPQAHRPLSCLAQRRCLRLAHKFASVIHEVACERERDVDFSAKCFVGPRRSVEPDRSQCLADEREDRVATPILTLFRDKRTEVGRAC